MYRPYFQEMQAYPALLVCLWSGYLVFGGWETLLPTTATQADIKAEAEAVLGLLPMGLSNEQWATGQSVRPGST